MGQEMSLSVYEVSHERLPACYPVVRLQYRSAVSAGPSTTRTQRGSAVAVVGMQPVLPLIQSVTDVSRLDR